MVKDTAPLPFKAALRGYIRKTVLINRCRNISNMRECVLCMHRGAHAVFDGTKSIRAVFYHKARGEGVEVGELMGTGQGNAKQKNKQKKPVIT